jgi:hypothetical protein
VSSDTSSPRSRSGGRSIWMTESSTFAEQFGFDFDVDGLTHGVFCEREFEDAFLQDRRRFLRLDFG